MANAEEPNRVELTPNEIVAYNLSLARNQARWTQAELGRRLAPYLGEKWSAAVVSSAEKSYRGRSGRIRRFTADEVVAFAQVFDLPVVWFFIPPHLPDEEVSAFVGPREGTKEEEGAFVERLVGFRYGAELGARLASFPTAARLNLQEWVRGTLAGMVARYTDLDTLRQLLSALESQFAKIQEDITRLALDSFVQTDTESANAEPAEEGEREGER
jgi:hypothetical protein